MSDGIDPLDETAAESAPRTTSTAPERKRIGPYELISKLGEGGMGVVWRAHDPKLDREIAIKVLKRDDAPQSLRQRLQREARAMARLKHQNVLTVYDSGTEGDRDYIAMELVDGASLDVWLEAQPPEREVIDAMLAAGRGLAAAHRAGLVHRDFKPQNVLRSASGRVMVTDFGLARGLGDEHVTATVDESPRAKGLPELGVSGSDVTVDATPDPGPQGKVSTKSKTDSVLDSPLTQTGMLLGTPAYMSPEQFEGAAPDPRTDQFAFCVTAWQMLTGGRPFTGGTITEIQLAASEGAANVKTMLPPLIRLALVRGLEPDPKRRWPDMDALLDELERATRPKRPAWVVPVISLVIVGLVVGAFAIARRGRIPASAGRPCEPADKAFGDAWSPELRAQLLRDHPLNADQFAAIAASFDAYRENWMNSYDEMCRTTPDKLPAARLSCLLAARDNVAAVTMGLTLAPSRALRNFDAVGALPNLAMCKADHPAMQPFAPMEKRAAVAALLARGFGLRASENVDTELTGLLEEAKKVGWQPVIPVLQMFAANVMLQRHQLDAARVLLNDALAGAQTSRDIRLQGSIRLSMLEASNEQLEKPDTSIKPGELPTEIAKLLDAARVTANKAGDPLLIASASLLEANAWAARARWTRDKKMYEAALAAARDARQRFDDAGDLTRAANAATREANIVLERADDRALDDAVYAARSAADALQKAKLTVLWDLGEIQARVAFARGEYGEANQRYALLGPHQEVPADANVTLHGVVTNAAGVPASGATVIAWTGELLGDPNNLVTDERTLEGERVVTEADGSFTIHVSADSAIVTQWKTERSVPMALRGKTGAPLAVKTSPASGLANGTVTGTWFGELDAFVRYDIDMTHWYVRAPVHRDRTFVITGLPEGKTVLGLRGVVGDGERTVIAAGKATELAWPSGPALDIVVRGPTSDQTFVWVLPFTEGSFTTPASIEMFALSSPNSAVGALHPIGADATPGGKSVYAVADRHCVLSNNASGKLTVCVADGGGMGAGSTVCAPLEVTVPAHDGPLEPAVAVIDTSTISAAPPK
ncbi:MAG TPA: protein kinase [Kofleriaceae bacterium]